MINYTNEESLACGCYIEYYTGFKDKPDHIIFCPKHKAAPDLYKALKDISVILANPLTTRTEKPIRIRIHRAADEAWQISLKALAKAEVKNE